MKVTVKPDEEEVKPINPPEPEPPRRVIVE